MLGAEYRKRDSVYLDKRAYVQPKEYFKLIGQILEDHYGGKSLSLIDYGCASGAFVHYAKQRLNLTKCVGVDISEELIHEAKASVPGVEFHVDSLTDPKVKFEQEFDLCVCLGTLCIFDEIDAYLGYLLSLVKPGGSMIVCDAFNEDPVDSIVRYRVVYEDSDGEWHAGRNIRSMLTMEKMIRRQPGNLQVKWFDFEMPFPIPRGNDPMRAWTMETEQKKRQSVVGTCQLLNRKVLQIIRP